MPFEGNHTADEACKEMEFDTPALGHADFYLIPPPHKA